MTDDIRPNDEDRRDERIAAALEVPPLDDVTRRRLVRRALDESGTDARRPGRSTKLLAVAAAVLAVLVIGGGTVLVLRDDGDDSTVASRTDDARGAGEAEDAAAPAAVTVPIGDLGDISDPAVLRERIETATAQPPAAESATTAQTECSVDVVELGSAEAEPVPVGTGTYEGVPALVFVAPSFGSGRIAVVLDSATCDTLAEVPI